MKTSVEKLSETRVKLTVNVPFDELSSEIDQAYAAIAQQVTIPGFRQGKAPRQLIDARFGRGPILEQVINDMLPSRYQAAVEEEGIKAIGQPEVDIAKIEDKEFVEFTAEVDVRPEIEVPNFEEFAVTVPVLANNDDAVTEKIDELRARFAELVDTDAKIRKDHFATIDLNVEVEGEKVDALSTEGLSYRVGSGDLMHGLDKALTGLRSGEEAEFTTELVGGEHAGKEATVKVAVGQVKRRKLPTLNDEFVQEASEFDTVEELTEDTRTQVEAQAKAAQAAAIRDEVLNKALEATSFELPQSVVDEQVHSQLHQVLGQMAHDDKALTQLLEMQGKTREDFDNEMRADAEKSVRTQLFLDAVADEVAPEVSQEELTDHILFTAQSYGMDPAQFISQLQQADQIGNLFADVRRGKALAEVICKVDVTDEDGNKVDAEEYFGMEEATQEEPAEAAEEAADDSEN